MIWRDVPGWEFYYEVSACGRVRSRDRIVVAVSPITRKLELRTYKGKILKAGIGKNGYFVVRFTLNGKGRSYYVHDLVSRAFIGIRPEGWETCHYNGIKTDNRVENLRYDTVKGNQADRKRHREERRIE